MKDKIPNNHKLCLLCGQAWRERQRDVCFICGLANLAYRLVGTGQAAAHKAVHREIRHGNLLPAANFPCVDCGKPGAAYEHRDYNKPLEVEPVCRSCNSKRLGAIPKRMTFDEFLAALQKSRFADKLTREQVEPLRSKYFKEQA